MSDQARWDTAKRLFQAALELAPDEREAYLRHACESTPEVLAEVRSLLHWHVDSTGYLETPAARVAHLSLPGLDADSLLGRSLGPWRIVGIIGRGGMGRVYKAERADAAFHRFAALKVVGADREPAGFDERFRRERETLATLDHPNIARLYDGGTTDDGRPYYVMEFVDGIPVDRFCDERRLSIDQRLDLFCTICAGVQYAHQTLVVHRDIKPDNILVSREGIPKLLDFGIAKLLSEVTDRAEDVGATAATWLMTPAYASPEQVRGRTVTTATDVYSLGVLLHVLLTGLQPYHITGGTPAEVEAQLNAAQVDRPSVAVGDESEAGRSRAAARVTTPRRLSARLAGDLDAIVLRAISRDLATRYATVEQLAEDIVRHRSSYPVTARSGDLGYIAGRFVRRHAIALVVAAGVLLLTGAGVAAVAWQARAAAEARARAEHRFNDVRQLAHAFMFDVHDAIVNVPGTTRARALMVSTAVQYLDTLASEASGDRGLQRELASAYLKVGDAQGHPTSANVGDTTGARASYRRAIEIASSLVTTGPDDVEAQRTLAMAHRRLADVLAWTGELAEARTQCETSQRLFAGIAARPEPTVEDRLQAGVAQIKLGDLLGNPNLPNLGRMDEAMVRYEEALAALRALDAAEPGDERVRRYVGLDLERLGTLHEAAGRWAAARDAYQQSFEIRRALAVAAPHHADIQRDLAIALEKLGNVQRAEGDLDAAILSYRGALAQFELLSKADPPNVIAARSVAISREKLGDALSQARRDGEAAALLEAALRTHAGLAASDEGNAQARCDTARVAEMLGDASTRGQRVAPSAPAGERACSRWRQSLDARRGLREAGLAACATDGDIARLSAKLEACR